MKKYFLFGVFAALAAVVVGCSGYGSSSSKTTTAASTSQASGGSSVTIQGFAFSPSTLTVSVGTKVTWTNKDGTTHTVTSDTGVFNSGNVANGGSYSYTFNTAGTFQYHCSIHSNMTGTIVVK